MCFYLTALCLPFKKKFVLNFDWKWASEVWGAWLYYHLYASQPKKSGIACVRIVWYFTDWRLTFGAFVICEWLRLVKIASLLLMLPFALTPFCIEINLELGGHQKAMTIFIPCTIWSFRVNWCGETIEIGENKCLNWGRLRFNPTNKSAPFYFPAPHFIFVSVWLWHFYCFFSAFMLLY